MYLEEFCIAVCLEECFEEEGYWLGVVHYACLVFQSEDGGVDLDEVGECYVAYDHDLVLSVKCGVHCVEDYVVVCNLVRCGQNWADLIVGVLAGAVLKAAEVCEGGGDCANQHQGYDDE